MQPLTASPRTEFSAAQVTSVLTADDLVVDFGLDLLDASLAWVEDLSEFVSSIVVHRDNLADIHGTLDLTISRELAWGRDRVRPFMLLSSITAGVSDVRFNLGAFICTTPDRVLGESPQSFTVSGFDGLYQLQNPIGDSYSVAAGANVLTAVGAALTAAGVTAPILLDTSSSTKVLATAMTWPQTSSESPTWIGVANALLAAIGYRGLWTDWNGAFRASPYVLPASRASEFSLDVGDMVTGIVGDRSVSADIWGVPNWFRAIRQDMPSKPVIGAGLVTFENFTTGITSQAALGRVVKAPVAYVDAVSQADFLTQANRLYAAATRVSEVLTLKVGPLPICWAFDRLTLNDPDLGEPREVLGRSWDLPLTGEDGTYVLETV